MMFYKYLLNINKLLIIYLERFGTQQMNKD